jgi:hypothetical protein
VPRAPFVVWLLVALGADDAELLDALLPELGVALEVPFVALSAPVTSMGNLMGLPLADMSIEPFSARTSGFCAISVCAYLHGNRGMSEHQRWDVAETYMTFSITYSCDHAGI